MATLRGVFCEGTPDEFARGSLATGLRARDLDIDWAVETILRSRVFFDESNLGNRVLSPVEFVVGSAYALEITEPTPSTPVLADWTGRLGQDLFYPPNVSGWTVGRQWITTRWAIGRANYAWSLLEGSPVGMNAPFDPAALAMRYGRGHDSRFIARLLIGRESPEIHLEPALATRHSIARLLGSAEAQRA